MDNEKKEFENTEFENSEIQEPENKETESIENEVTDDSENIDFSVNSEDGNAEDGQAFSAEEAFDVENAGEDDLTEENDNNMTEENEKNEEDEGNQAEVNENDLAEENSSETDISDEERQFLIAEKKKKAKKTALIAAIVVFCLFIAGVVYSLCVVNGVGSKSVVNTSLPAKYSSDGQKLEEEKFNIKFENPFVSLLGGTKADVIKVNGYGIGADVFNYFVKSSALNYEYELYQSKKITDLKSFDWNAVDEETGLKNSEIAKGDAVKSISSILAVIGEAEKRGITLTEEEEKEITDWIEQIKKSYGDNLENVLKQSGYDSLEQLTEIQRLQKLYQNAYDAFNDEPLSYVKQFKNYEKTLSGDKITVCHVLIKFPDGVTKDSAEEEKAEARKKAEEVLKKAKSGEDFSALMDTYNEDPGEGKYGYTFADDGSMVQEFTDAAFKLEIGGISDIVETSYGYHIIKRTERIPDFSEYIKLIQDNMKVRINRYAYANVVVDADISEYMGDAAAAEENSGTDEKKDTEASASNSTAE